MAATQIESLLEAWINMEMSIRGNRVLQDMSFNEMIVCHFLLRRQRAGTRTTASDLCDQMHLLKSQMNALLTSLEHRGYVARVRSSNDKRKSYVELTEAGAAQYHAEHVKIIQIMHAIIEAIGEEESDNLTALLDTATAIYQRNTTEES